jgi:hypothetical protein
MLQKMLKVVLLPLNPINETDGYGLNSKECPNNTVYGGQKYTFVCFSD